MIVAANISFCNRFVVLIVVIFVCLLEQRLGGQSRECPHTSPNIDLFVYIRRKTLPRVSLRGHRRGQGYSM